MTISGNTTFQSGKLAELTLSARKHKNNRFLEAAEEVVNFLDDNIDLSQCNFFEPFAQTGAKHTKQFYQKVKNVEAWEIDKNLEKELRKNLPDATIKICDSIEVVSSDNFILDEKFDILAIDAPLNCYGEQEQYCEHFDFFSHIPKLVKDHGVVIFNVITSPFNYKDSPRWKERREAYYDSTETGNMSVDFMVDFYKNKIKELGYNTNFEFTTCREIYKGNEYFHYVVFGIQGV